MTTEYPGLDVNLDDLIQYQEAHIACRQDFLILEELKRIREAKVPDEAVNSMHAVNSDRINLAFDLAEASKDAGRYRWLRTHFRFANDSVREIWFDPNIDLAGAYGAHEPDELDAAIDAAIKEPK